MANTDSTYDHKSKKLTFGVRHRIYATLYSQTSLQGQGIAVKRRRLTTSMCWVRDTIPTAQALSFA